MAEAVIEAIQKAAGSGKIGDGKIFVTGLTEVVRIRTGERRREGAGLALTRLQIIHGRCGRR